MKDETPQLNGSPRGWLLRSPDQVCVAVLTGVSLCVIVGSWGYHHGLRGRLIDVETTRAEPIHFQIDINGADWPEWTVLPGVGEVLAKRIIASRETDGEFRDHSDLLRVPGIGPRTLERIRPYLMPMPQANVVAGP